jgi:hypothetical protein
MHVRKPEREENENEWDETFHKNRSKIRAPLS